MYTNPFLVNFRNPIFDFIDLEHMDYSSFY